ncbi:uncharacterized protein AB9W97_002401 [Spinachia spinachia]
MSLCVRGEGGGLPGVSLETLCVWGTQLSWMQPHNQSAREAERGLTRFDLRRSGVGMHMAGLAALGLLLSCSQNTLQSEQEIIAHRAPAHLPSPPPPHIHDLLREGETSHLNAKRTYPRVDKDTGRAGLFLAAAMGTIALMSVVYCIYDRFYTKPQYLHTQLTDDSDLTMDPLAVSFYASPGSSAVDVQRPGYGSLSDTPSIISVPPCLSPPPSAMPFPPFFLSSHSLRTISARDLERSCI